MKEQVKIKILSSAVTPSPFANGMHKQYRLELSNKNNSTKSYKFTFHDSVASYANREKLNKADALYSVLMDMQAYSSTQNFEDFCDEFGYNKWDEYPTSDYEDYYLDYDRNSLEIFNACKKAYDSMRDMFTDEELDQLQEEFQDY